MIDLFRKITSAVFILFIIILVLFSHLEDNIIISISVILLFLTIFLYLFDNSSFAVFKMGIMLFTFLVLPILIINYLGIFTLFGFWTGVLACFIAISLGFLFIFTLIKLNYIEIEYEGELDE